MRYFKPDYFGFEVSVCGMVEGFDSIFFVFHLLAIELSCALPCRVTFVGYFVQ